jgi:hypothetical protein
MILAVPIEEGAEIDECQRCKKVFLTAGIQQWQQSTMNTVARSCPHCRNPYNERNIKRGKARLFSASA